MASTLSRIFFTLPLLATLLAGCTLPTDRGLLYRPAAAAGPAEFAELVPDEGGARGSEVSHTAPGLDIPQRTPSPELQQPVTQDPADAAEATGAAQVPGPEAELQPTQTETEAAGAAQAPGPEAQPTATQAPAGEDETGPVEAAGMAPEMQARARGAPAADPLRFVFPTQVAAPASAWRPPLYPTPWAMKPYDHFFFARPIAADQINWPLADYRYGGTFFEDVVHTGIDIPARTGTPVLAAGPGEVTWAGKGLYYLDEEKDGPYGLAVAIRHDFGFEGQTLFTIYGHMDRIDVVKGQRVATGDLLGLSGETGNTTGPHLHFEVRVGKNNFFGSRNPELWLSPPQGWGLLAARVMNTSGELAPGLDVTVWTKDMSRKWVVRSYGDGSANSDAYYRENLVLGDLPAGEYIVWIPYAGSIYDLEVTIQPGMVTYFTFEGTRGYKRELPKGPGAGFVPPGSEPGGG